MKKVENQMGNSQKKILDVATRMVREGGYNHFSFREIANEVGIKSSSVHYYFPTKADLGAALVTNFYRFVYGASGRSC